MPLLESFIFEFFVFSMFSSKRYYELLLRCCAPSLINSTVPSSPYTTCKRIPHVKGYEHLLRCTLGFTDLLFGVLQTSRKAVSPRCYTTHRSSLTGSLLWFCIMRPKKTSGLEFRDHPSCAKYDNPISGPTSSSNHPDPLAALRPDLSSQRWRAHARPVLPLFSTGDLFLLP